MAAYTHGIDPLPSGEGTGNSVIPATTYGSDTACGADTDGAPAQLFDRLVGATAMTRVSAATA